MSTAAEQNPNEPEINLFDPEVLKDPWDAYKTLRDDAPVYFVPQMGLHVVTRYDLVMEAVKDVETYSSQFDQFLAQARMKWLEGAPESVQQEYAEITKEQIIPPATMLTADPPKHTKYRSLVNRVFTAGQVRKMEDFVEQIISDQLNSVIDETGEIDFMARIAGPIPLKIIANRLGVAPDEFDFFAEAATAAADGLRLTTPSPEEVLRRARLSIELQNYLIDRIEDRRKDPKDDMIGIVANAKLEDEDRVLNHGECISILNQFLVAGHETTTSTFGFGMYILCRHPELADQIRGDSKRIRTFVEEALRLEAPVQGLPRVVTKDTRLGDTQLKAGDMIMLRYGAANRDERHFEAPDECDVHRKNAGSQLAFGSGVHHCVGAPLARSELNIGFAMMLEQMENFRLSRTPEVEPSFILRSFPELWIEFDKRS